MLQEIDKNHPIDIEKLKKGIVELFKKMSAKFQDQLKLVQY